MISSYWLCCVAKRTTGRRAARKVAWCIVWHLANGKFSPTSREWARIAILSDGKTSEKRRRTAAKRGRNCWWKLKSSRSIMNEWQSASEEMRQRKSSLKDTKKVIKKSLQHCARRIELCLETGQKLAKPPRDLFFMLVRLLQDRKLHQVFVVFLHFGERFLLLHVKHHSTTLLLCAMGLQIDS